MRATGLSLGGKGEAAQLTLRPSTEGRTLADISAAAPWIPEEMTKRPAPRPSLHGFPVRQNLIIPRQDSIPDAFFLPASFFQLLLPPLGFLQLWESQRRRGKAPFTGSHHFKWVILLSHTAKTPEWH